MFRQISSDSGCNSCVLKAGGTYLSLDPKHPQTKKAHIIEDDSAKIILTNRHYQNDFDSVLTVLSIDQTLIDSLSNLPKAGSAPGNSGDAAFVVFMSNSTGVRKHRYGTWIFRQ